MALSIHVIHWGKAASGPCPTRVAEGVKAGRQATAERLGLDAWSVGRSPASLLGGGQGLGFTPDPRRLAGESGVVGLRPTVLGAVQARSAVMAP